LQVIFLYNVQETNNNLSLIRKKFNFN